MSYEIKIKGLNEAIRVDDHTIGEKARKVWQNYIENKVDQIINLPDWQGAVSQIKYFRKVSGLNSYKNKNDSLQEYNEDRKKILAMSPIEKSKRLGFFRFIYWSFTGQMSEDVKTNSGKPIEELVIPIQLNFFTKNPNRIVCDPAIYKPLIKSSKISKTALRVIENHIAQDTLQNTN